jgi:NADPH-dependent 2,4-dienoyl-CoA reductase/sulfur reductase-like enzyme
VRAIEALRREGFERDLVLVSAEPGPPYDRPPLSKDVLDGTREPDSVVVCSFAELMDLDIHTRFGSAAHGLDLQDRIVNVGRECLHWDAIILATGSRARRLPSLRDARGVFTLRTLADALALRDALASTRRLVVIGAGFIGSEVAASARRLGIKVTLIEQAPRPLEEAVGAEIAEMLAELHRDNGTDLRVGVSVADLELDRGQVKSVRLTDGNTVAADAVVIGIGAQPNVEWLAGCGLHIDGGVSCDAALNASSGVYALGDIASWDNQLFGLRMRVEHWTNATEQARHVARALAHGDVEPFLGTNYVWSDQYGLRLQCVGTATAEMAVVKGTIDERHFLAWYRDGDRLVGACALGLPRELMESRRLIMARAPWDDALASVGRLVEDVGREEQVVRTVES